MCAMAQEDQIPPEPPFGRSRASERRVAGAEVSRRRVNEAIDRGGRSDAPRVFMCECGRVGCNTTLTLGLGEYDNVRTSFERFLVAPGHDVHLIHDVLERHGSHDVVARRGAERPEADGVA